MSDLFCPATLIVARHAEAEYESPVVRDAGGSLTPLGRRQARSLAESLQDRRVAAIWCSDMARAVQTAEIAAAVLGVPVQVRAGLREFSVGEFAGQPYTDELFAGVTKAWLRGDLTIGCPGAETGAEILKRMRAELESVADQYRGETVLVVSHAGAMRVTLPRLATNVPDDFGAEEPIENCATSELSADADGWALRCWNGQPLEATESAR